MAVSNAEHSTGQQTFASQIERKTKLNNYVNKPFALAKSNAKVVYNFRLLPQK